MDTFLRFCVFVFFAFMALSIDRALSCVLIELDMIRKWLYKHGNEDQK